MNIQSLTGAIHAGPGVIIDPLFSLASLCDNPVFNLTSNGNANNVVDAGDYPCMLSLSALGTVQFDTSAALPSSGAIA